MDRMSIAHTQTHTQRRNTEGRFQLKDKTNQKMDGFFWAVYGNSRVVNKKNQVLASNQEEIIKKAKEKTIKVNK